MPVCPRCRNMYDKLHDMTKIDITGGPACGPCRSRAMLDDSSPPPPPDPAAGGAPD